MDNRDISLPTYSISPEVAHFLATPVLTGVVGGRNHTAVKGATFETLDPGNGKRLATVSLFDVDDVDVAVGAAKGAFHAWASMRVEKRWEWISRLANELEQRKKIIAEIEALDAGKLMAQAEADVQVCIDTLRYFNDMALQANRRQQLDVKGYQAWTVKQPWGPCGFIFPWNFPILLIGWGVSPALAAGNTVVIKPAEDTPLSAIYLAQIAREIGFPDGVINVVTGLGPTAGSALSAHPDIKQFSFTGSPETGRLVAQACAKNLTPCKLELGGKGGALVFDDVDVQEVATKLARAITTHAGQVCCNATRWIVHERIYDDFVAASIRALKAKNVGYQMAPDNDMGPVVSAKQRKRVLGYVDEGVRTGARLLMQTEVTGSLDGTGFYVGPVLMEGSAENIACRDEIFGPVAYLLPFKDEADAIHKVNASDYGLANSVWTADMERAARVAEQMQAGNSWINAHNIFPHGVPYGGINKSGMGGGVNSPETLMDYWRNLSVVRPL